MLHRLTVALLAGVVLCGCGDDKTPEQTASSPTATPERTATAGVTHDEFVEDLNRTCSGDKRRLDELNDQLSRDADAGNYEGAADALQALTSLAEPHWEQQRQLEPPAEDQAAFTEYMDAQQQFQGLMRRYIRALRTHDDDALESMAPLVEDTGNERLRAAIKLGADDCGS